MQLVNITDCNNLTAWLIQKTVNQIETSRAQSNDGNVDAIVGSGSCRSKTTEYQSGGCAK